MRVSAATVSPSHLATVLRRSPMPRTDDCHNNIFRDYVTDRWIATTRTEIDFYPQNEDRERSGRQISMAATPGAALLKPARGAATQPT